MFKSLAAAVILAVSPWAIAQSLPTTVPTSQPSTRAAKRVLFAVPFENATGKEQYDPAAAGLADLVAVLLAQQEHVKVVERQRLESLTAEQARSLKGLTGQKYALAAGKLLSADTVLVGRVFLVQGKMTLNVQALDIATERVAAAEELSGRPESLVEDAFQLARGLAKQMSLPLPAIDPSKVDQSPIASLHLAKGLSHYYAGNLDAAILQFMRAIDLDPDCVESHYWQGVCYAKLKEPAHAVIELEAFLARQKEGKYAQEATKLLAQARLEDKDSLVPRLFPASGQGSPTTRP